MKICNRCKESKEPAEFSIDSKAKDGKQKRCKSCQRELAASHYLRNKPAYQKSRTKSRRLKKEYIWEYLLTHPCVDCGEQDPVVLDFDHVRGKKLATISNMLCISGTLSQIKREVAKCEIRCSNCHRRRHAREQNFLKFRKSEEIKDNATAD